MTKNLRIVGLSCAVAIFALISVGILSAPANSVENPKRETIEATAQGTDLQLGAQFNVTIIIEGYSTPEERQTLMQAFQQDQNQGLYKALSKIKAVGHIAITGGLGYDLSYIRSIPNPTGRTIRFVTRRPISIREENRNSVSTDYNLTAGELELNDMDKSKSTGVLYPRAMLKMDKDNEVKFDLATEPYKLTSIIDHGDGESRERESK